MTVTRVGKYMLSIIPGKPMAIESLRNGDVVRQSLSTELLVIWGKVTYAEHSTLYIRRVAGDIDSQESIELHFPNEEMVWHVGELV